MKGCYFLSHSSFSPFKTFLQKRFTLLKKYYTFNGSYDTFKTEIDTKI